MFALYTLFAEQCSVELNYLDCSVFFVRWLLFTVRSVRKVPRSNNFSKNRFTLIKVWVVHFWRILMITSKAEITDFKDVFEEDSMYRRHPDCWLRVSPWSVETGACPRRANVAKTSRSVLKSKEVLRLATWMWILWSSWIDQLFLNVTPSILPQK